MPTKPTQIRFTDSELAQIERLKAIVGQDVGLRDMTTAALLRIAITRLEDSYADRSQKQPGKKSQK